MAHRPSNLRSLTPIAGLAIALCWTPPVCAATAVKLTGSLIGSVRDAAGVPQFGATVLLFNRYDKLVERAVTNLRGDFLFDPLPSDTYSVRVTMPSFVPAIKRNILVQPGMQSVLAISLATLFSSIELVYTSPQNGNLMSDEWKWVLRSSMNTRPVLRILPEIREQDPSSPVFSDTSGMVRVSTGESNPYSSAFMDQSDMGTAFALATSIYGNNHVQFTGNLGYALEAASPTTGVSATFSRGETSGGSWPEVKVTMQQTAMPLRATGQQRNLPVYRAMSVLSMDHTRITPSVDLEYGVSYDSVQFYDRLNYFSPFARLTYDLHDFGELQVGYSSGAPPVQLVLDSREGDAALRQEIVTLSLMPRVSVLDGHAQVQRAENFEVGYHFRHGSRSYAVGVYREYVTNGAVTVMGAGAEGDGGLDLLPQIGTDGSIFNIGNYSRVGYSASVTQNLGDSYNVTLAWGNGGVMRADARTLESDDAADLRSMLHPSQEQWLAGRVNAVVPWLGTRVSASYQWTDSRALTPTHIYFTQPSLADPGLNIRIRQPIPPVFGMPGRFEATAEMRNLLAQGYLPVQTASGRILILTQAPRAIRGGLSFIF
jgi:hypothetical protein